MSDQAVILPKWLTHGGIILAKGQLDHLYSFWTIPNLIYYPTLKFWYSLSTFNVTIFNFGYLRTKCASHMNNMIWWEFAVLWRMGFVRKTISNFLWWNGRIMLPYRVGSWKHFFHTIGEFLITRSKTFWKIESVNKAFLFWYWQRPKFFF